MNSAETADTSPIINTEQGENPAANPSCLQLRPEHHFFSFKCGWKCHSFTFT